MLYLMFLFLISVASVTPRAIEADFLTVDPERALVLFNIFTNCAEKTGVDSRTVQNVIAWIFEDNESVKKYLYCFVTKAGYGDSDGHIIKENFLKSVGNHKSRDEFINVVNECNKLKGINKYDTAFKASRCIREMSPILFKV